MPNTSIGGLVSGLDTATIISQLMQLEARPQTMLKSRVSNEQKVVTALQALNTKLAGIATKAADLAKASAWSTANATSDNEKVTVTTASGAVPATLALTVEQVATSHTIDFGLHALSDKVTTDGSTIVKLDTLDGKVLDLDTKDGTVQGLVNAINSTDQGVKATLVKVDAANYRLTLTSTTTGPSSDFELQDVSGLGQDDAGTTLALVGASAAGLQARIKVGADTILGLEHLHRPDARSGRDARRRREGVGDHHRRAGRDLADGVRQGDGRVRERCSQRDRDAHVVRRSDEEGRAARRRQHAARRP
jgi:flagellar hook-associated protein 2